MIGRKNGGKQCLWFMVSTMAHVSKIKLPNPFILTFWKQHAHTSLKLEYDKQMICAMLCVFFVLPVLLSV